jgi:hypothetical protein
MWLKYRSVGEMNLEFRAGGGKFEFVTLNAKYYDSVYI